MTADDIPALVERLQEVEQCCLAQSSDEGDGMYERAEACHYAATALTTLQAERDEARTLAKPIRKPEGNDSLGRMEFRSGASHSTRAKQRFGKLRAKLRAQRLQTITELESTLEVMTADRDALRATLARQQAAHARLREALEGLLKFQYAYRGYGSAACSSCGAHATQDEFGTKAEKCSTNCPWSKARAALTESSK